MMKTINIAVHKYNLATFEKRVAEINQKFEKHGYPYIEYKEISVDEENHIHNFEVYSSFEQKNLIGEKVRFEGMIELINKEESSKLFHVSENIYNIISSEKCVCDKCKKDIKRGKYIIFSKDVEVKSRKDLYILGSTCAKEFFPFDIADYIGKLNKYFDEFEIEYEEFDFEKGSANFDISDIALVTLDNTKDFTKVYEKQKTLISIQNDFGLFLNCGKEYKNIYGEFSEYKVKKAEEAVKVAREYFENHCYNEFDFNCNSILEFDKVPEKYFRMAVCAIYFGVVKSRKLKEQEASGSQYVGAIGEKFSDWELTYNGSFGFQSVYGYTHIIKFLDQNKNSIVWYSSKGIESVINSINIKIGDKVNIKGTIKDHKEYKGEKQTLITRCKLTKPFKQEDIVEEYQGEHPVDKALREMEEYLNSL